MLNVIYPIIGNEVCLPFYVTGAGISEPEFDVRRETGLVSHQFLFTKSGRGVLKVGGESFLQREGSLFYLAPSVPHEYAPENGDWCTCWVVFRGCGLGDTMRSLGFGDFAVRDEAADDEIRQLFSRIMAAARNPLGGGEECSQLMYEFVLCARKALLFPKSAEGSPLDNALHLIDEQYMNDLTLEQLSVTAGVSLQHFCRIFRARTGMRPMEYLARRRIAEAKVLLCNSQESISAIGARCGYPDPTYFGMVFRKYEGISPSEYRQRKGSGIL